jgi:hypothetical protein
VEYSRDFQLEFSVPFNGKLLSYFSICKSVIQGWIFLEQIFHENLKLRAKVLCFQRQTTRAILKIVQESLTFQQIKFNDLNINYWKLRVAFS